MPPRRPSGTGAPAPTDTAGASAPAPHPATPAWEPYRILFPLGATLGLLGAGVWPLAVWPGIPYPGLQHAALMIQGFELAFVAGFLLTVAPRMTRTSLLDQRELPWIALLLLGFAVAASLRQLLVAHALTLATLLLLAVAVTRRFLRRNNDPPEETVFVPLGIALGLAGTLLQLGAAAGWLMEPAPRLGLRLLSLGMVLALVLGFGSLLVPVFLEMRKPLFLPGIADPHERPARRAFYSALAAVLVLSFAADALAFQGVGPYARALVATAVLALAWKVWRLPGRRTVAAYAIWVSGWLVGLGLWLAALSPLHAIAATHVTLLGGFGALTMGIASRVVVTHGGHAPAEETRLFTPVRAAWLALSLVTRLAAEVDVPRSAQWLALSGLAWIAAWVGWGLSAWPHLGAAVKPSPSSGSPPVPLRTEVAPAVPLGRHADP